MIEIETDDEASAFEKTCEAMRAGADVIVQATLAGGRWRGRADVLLKLDRTSGLGDWSYEVVDTKLARETKAGTVLQLCLYSELVGEIQGERPERMYVVTPARGFEPEPYRLDDYAAYCRQIMRRLEASIEVDDETYPEPAPQCDVCRWWPACDHRWRQDDHPTLVAGISKLQRRELEETFDVTTLEGLAKIPVRLEHKPKRGSADGLERIREQAHVQLQERLQDEPVFELLDLDAGKGLFRLPEPSTWDMFFDIEGDPFVGTTGHEYLFGHTSGADYAASWALNPAEEHVMFEDFVTAVMDRWEEHPDMHVYHFGHYEKSTLKRLMGRHAVCEDEVDRMLRAELLVDLHAVVKQSVRASVERYSIKELEKFYGFERDVALREASANLRAVESALELEQPEIITDEIRQAVEGYNRDDCVSAEHLRDWLEARRSELVEQGLEIARPEPQSGDPSEEVGEREERVRELMDKLACDVPLAPDERTPEQHARWLLAELLEWHRRENKAPWWDYFRLRDLPDEDLFDESSAINGLQFIERFEPEGRSKLPVDRYTYPAQETRVSEGDSLRSSDGEKFGTAVGYDRVLRFLDIKKHGDTIDLHPTGIYVHNFYRTEVQAEALFSLGEWVATNDIAADG